MRHPIVVAILLALFGLVPLGLWLVLAINLEPTGLGRSIGIALLVLLSPLPFGGLLMLVGAGILERTRRLGRVLATIGAAIVAAGGAVIAAKWLQGYTMCGGSPGACLDELIESLGCVAFALANAALIVPIWRARRRERSAVCPFHGT